MPLKRAVRRVGDDGVGERVAVHIRAAQGDRLGGVFVGRNRLGVGNRSVVDRVDRDADRCRAGVHLAVVDDELEAVGAVVIRRRGVGQVGGRAAQGAVGWGAGHAVGQRVAIRV